MIGVLKLTRTTRLLVLLWFFLCIRELVDLDGHMTCWTGTETEGPLWSQALLNSCSTSWPLLPSFLLLCRLTPFVYFFQNLRFPLPRAFRAALGSVTQAWYKNWRGQQDYKTQHEVKDSMFNDRTHFWKVYKQKQQQQISAAPRQLRHRKRKLKVVWVKTQPLADIIVQNTCNHHDKHTRRRGWNDCRKQAAEGNTGGWGGRTMKNNARAN